MAPGLWGAVDLPVVVSVGCIVNNLRCLCRCAQVEADLMSQRPKWIRNRMAYLRVFTESLEADDALEFVYPIRLC